MTDEYNVIINVVLDGTKKLEYNFSSEFTFMDLKKQIINDFFNCDEYRDYKYLILDNITEKIYRNFGKVCIMNGPISSLFDNRNLYEFFNENQELILNVIPKLEQESLKIKKSSPSASIKKYKKSNLRDLENNVPRVEIQPEFVYREEDFPSLS